MERGRAFNRRIKTCLYQNEREYMVSRQRCLFFPLHVVKVIKELEKPLVEAEFFFSIRTAHVPELIQCKTTPPKAQTKTNNENHPGFANFPKLCDSLQSEEGLEW